MGLFGQSLFDADIEKATSETNTNENWSHILDVCDKVSTNPRSAKDCLKAIMKRMGHADPHVVMQAITLLDACANNCGKPFHLEIASRDFENEFRRLLSKAQPKVAMKMRQVLKTWAENDFKNDPELNLIPSLYAKLREENYDFSKLDWLDAKSVVKTSAVPKDPNVVSSQQEEDDIAKAIELSLKETKTSPNHQAGTGSSSSSTTTASAYPSLYPSFTGTSTAGSVTTNAASDGGSAANNTQSEPRKVRALYDFEAAEENELTFFAGEILHVLDDSDANWWKGYNQRGDGLFPSNFVTADLSVDPERLDINQQNKSKKTVQFEDDARELQQKTEAAAAAAANQRIEIDETKIDRLLHLLHEANPEDPSQDSDEMLRLEQEVHQMGPLIDAELERVDRKHAQLTQLSSDLVDAINLYHSLMRDDRAPVFSSSGLPGMGYQHAAPQMLYGAPTAAAASGGGYAHTSPLTVSSVNYAPNAMPLPMPIPMQFQNGHVNSALLNSSMNALPTNMTSGQAASQMFGTPTQPGPQQQQQQQNYQMLPQQQQYQQQPTPTPQQQQQQQQYMSPQHPQLHGTASHYMQQQQTPQQYTPISNGPPQQQQQAQLPYMSTAAVAAAPPQQQQTATNVGILQQQQQQHQQQQLPPTAANNANNNNNNNAEHYSQLQQQMAAMSLMGGHSLHLQQQPLQHINQQQAMTQHFLVQNETTNNIPIYQQQR